MPYTKVNIRAQYLYHDTSSIHLCSILKEGLIPNKYGRLHLTIYPLIAWKEAVDTVRGEGKEYYYPKRAQGGEPVVLCLRRKTINLCFYVDPHYFVLAKKNRNGKHSAHFVCGKVNTASIVAIYAEKKRLLTPVYLGV